MEAGRYALFMHLRVMSIASAMAKGGGILISHKKGINGNLIYQRSCSLNRNYISPHHAPFPFPFPFTASAGSGHPVDPFSPASIGTAYATFLFPSTLITGFPYCNNGVPLAR